jgi:hydrogenase expression/formation protein HypE
MIDDVITLSHGAGGAGMRKLIAEFNIQSFGGWENTDDDSATLDLGDGRKLAFTADSYTVDPIFFPGGDIGHLAVSGTINDLAVMGATPIGLSSSLIIEEGLAKKDLNVIVGSMKKTAQSCNTPIVAGDTKVLGCGMVDKIVINTSGVGIIESGIMGEKPSPGDKIIISGGLGEHAVALLSRRYDFQTEIVSDAKPLHLEMADIRGLVRMARDITRGGLAAVLNEITCKYGVGARISEGEIPVKAEVQRAVELLGIDLYHLASEGRLLTVTPPENFEKVLDLLKKHNGMAALIGEINSKCGVEVETRLGLRNLPMPEGEIIPRIC